MSENKKIIPKTPDVVDFEENGITVLISILSIS